MNSSNLIFTFFKGLMLAPISFIFFYINVENDFLITLYYTDVVCTFVLFS